MLGGMKVLLPLVFSAMVVLSSGCVTDPTTFAKTIPLVQDFLNDHPNAEIKIVHYTEAESEDMLDYIKEDCGKLSVEPKEYYFVNITDPSTDLVIRAWIDWGNQIVECVYKEGSIIDPSNCTSLYRARCFGDHVYWFDSCGNREEKKEYCPLGCSNGECVSGDICDVERSYTEKPRCVCPDGYEMLVLYPSCLEPVTGLITGMPFAVTDDAAENAVTTESGEVEISSDFTTDFVNRCPDTKPVYRCVRRQQCRSHSQAKCYKGHVYWFDSCGHVQEKKEYCSEGCDNGFCKGVRTCEQMGGYCTYPYNMPCTQEAKQCPDGTWVGRTGPNCEFAPCPVEADSATGMIHDTDTSITSTECYDSDGGKNYNQKGYARYGDTRYEDHCNSDGTLTEKYCYNGELAAVKVTCENGYCSDGACVYGETPSSVPGGGGIGGGISYPVCRDGYVRANYWCPGSGVCCIPERVTCTDSDGGKDFYEKGTTCIGGDSAGTATGDVYCEVDRCLHPDCVGCPDQLVEYYCGEGDSEEWMGSGLREINHVYTECRYGCRDGACLREERCAGEGELTSGAVSPDYYYGCCDGLESFDPWPPGWDGGGMLCYNPEKGVPVCDGEGTDDEGWYYPTGEFLVEWDCSHSIECTDSDGGENYYVKGTLTSLGTGYEDYCWKDKPDHSNESQYANYLREYSCELNQDPLDPNIEGYGGSDDTGFYEINYDCPYGCEDGVCLPEPECDDSDGGKDYFTKGEVNPHCIAPCGVFIDTCSSNTTLIEHYCLEGEAMTEERECPYGCSEGACIACVDSDGGKDYGTRGELSLDCCPPETPECECGVFIDTCSSNTTLIEHYCLEGEAMTEEYQCECSDGICVA